LNIGLYMDVHVPYSVTYALRLRGVDVLTAQQDGADQLTDAALLNRATNLTRVLFRRMMIYSARRRHGSEVGNLFLG
jgi:hypothetical protein